MVDVVVALVVLCPTFQEGAAAVPATDEPRIHHVVPGLAWQIVAQDAKPGDRILLETGIHIGARLEDVHGTRERPIVIRGAADEVPTAIACEAYGIELVRCSWVRIENLYFMNPQEAAILIDGTVAAPAEAAKPGDASQPAAPDAPADGAGPRSDGAARPTVAADIASDVSIAIAGCHVAAKHRFPNLDAVRVINARNVGITGSRFDAWSGAGVSLHGASSVVIARCRFSPTEPWLHPAGVRADDACRAIVVLQNIFEGDIDVGVDVGPCAGDGGATGAEPDPPTTSSTAERAAPAPAPPSAARDPDVHVSRCAFVDVRVPLAVAGDARASLQHCTVVDAKAILRLDAQCGVPHASLNRLLVQWEAGRLATPVERLGDATPLMVELGGNLWWSEELPLYFEASPLFGVGREAQVIDVDPLLIRPQLVPQAELAVPFGWAAPPAPPEAPAARSDRRME